MRKWEEWTAKCPCCGAEFLVPRKTSIVDADKLMEELREAHPEVYGEDPPETAPTDAEGEE